MTGTLINIVTVLIGGTIGLTFGDRLPSRIKETVMGGLGLFTMAIGVQMFLKTTNPVIVLLSLLFGGLLGEWWQIERGLERFGVRMEKRFAGGDGATTDSQFVRGMLTASLVFCVGPMTILGSIQDGLYGDFMLLTVKSVLDMFAALAFASTLGVGVLFSVIVLLIYQGGLSLLAGQAQALLSGEMIAEMTAAGGVILIGLAISSLLEIKKIRAGNFLPALVIAPLITPLIAALLAWLGWNN
ncbi:MAG: DUF554 family protein [candidate division Zixibacteria bacterium]|nr:DUF554 family protein [Gammaproteobacteria bacterium]NIX55503.1 DUF554 family protein [candidate division Zixibacteria bacterium]